MTKLTFLDLLHIARGRRRFGFTIYESMTYLYGLMYGLERYYLE